jgi:hypothetical protein
VEPKTRPEQAPAAKEVPSLETELQFNDFLNPESCTEIVSNKTFPLGDWNLICKFKDTVPEINKRVIPIDARPYCMLVVTTVEPGTHVPEHSHDEGNYSVCATRFSDS